MTIKKKGWAWAAGMPGRAGLAVGLALVLVLGYGLLPRPPLAQAQAAAPKANEAPAVAVQVVSAQLQDVPLETRASATVVSLAALEVRPQVSGLVTRVHIREGQYVRAGQLLFSLDERSDRANLDKAQAQLARDQASLQDLQRQYRRSQELVAQQFVAQGAADTLQAQVAQQQAQLQLARASVQAAQVTLGLNRLVAAQDGRVGAINVFAGSLVNPATVLASVTQIDPIALSFTLPEAQLPALLASQKPRSAGAGAGSAAAVVADTSAAGTGGEISVAALLGSRTLQGRLSFFDNSVESSTGTIRVKAEFANHDGALWPGQFVAARLRLGTMHQAVVVPQAAIISGSQGKFVYTLAENQTAKVQPVQVLYAFGTLAVVRGLHGNEQVIVEGKQNLRAGSRIKPVGEPTSKPVGKGVA
jgi:RND family efflux transporter MFP subunit